MRGFSDVNPQTLADKLAAKLHYPPDLVNQTFSLSPGNLGNCIYVETMVDIKKIENYVPQMINSLAAGLEKNKDILQLMNIMPLLPMKVIHEFGDCIQALLEGNVIFLIPSSEDVLAVDAASSAHREVTEPQTETTVRGPREGLTEDIKLNMSLVRKRIKNPDLRFDQYVLGSKTKTNIALVFLHDLVTETVLNDFQRRLNSIQTDSILDSYYIEELIQGKKYTPFPTVLSTERPDIIASHILEGRVIVLVDGSPFALVGPITFFQFFTAPEDYYQRVDIATLLRWLRILSFTMAVFVPSLFVSVVSYHPELLPNPLLLNIAAQRENIPFPAFIEALLMLITFEVLREAGLRMPRIAGQAISIVGALVLGEAAVQAGLITAAMVIVVSVTAISNFVSPSYSFGIAQRLLQFTYLALSGFMGLYGILCGVLFTIVHLASLKSFGVPYLAPVAPTFMADWKDTLVRAPRYLMKTYPKMNHVKKKRR